MLDRILHGAFGNLVKHHALEFLVLQRLAFLEDFRQVPRDRLAFAVWVGCQQHGVSHLDRFRDGVHMAGVSLDDFVLHAEIVIGVDRPGLWHEIAHMAVRGEDLKILAEVLLERFRLGGRFNDEEICCHELYRWGLGSFYQRGAKAPESEDWFGPVASQFGYLRIFLVVGKTPLLSRGISTAGSRNGPGLGNIRAQYRAGVGPGLRNVAAVRAGVQAESSSRQRARSRAPLGKLRHYPCPINGARSRRGEPARKGASAPFRFERQRNLGRLQHVPHVDRAVRAHHHCVRHLFEHAKYHDKTVTLVRQPNRSTYIVVAFVPSALRARRVGHYGHGPYIAAPATEPARGRNGEILARTARATEDRA